MAAANETKIVLTAEDRTSAGLQSVTRGLQGIESQAMLATKALGAIGVTFGAAAAVAMVKGTIDAADGFNDLSQKVGISVRQLAGWTLAANQSGTSMESVAKGVKGLSTYMVEHGDKLRAAGITATDANGAMIQLADLFKSMPDGVQKTALAVQLMGKAGMDMIPVMNLGSKGLAEAQEKADAYGKKMADLAPDADKFNDQVEEMALHMKALGINITGFVIAPLTNMATALNDLAAGGARAEKQMAWLADQGHPIAKAVMAWSGVFKSMGIGENRSQGYTGPKNAAGLPATDEDQFSAATDAYLAQRKSSLAAAGLLDKSTTKTGGTGETALQRMIKRGNANLAASGDSEEEQRILAEKRAMQEARQEFEALQRMIKRGEDNELALYYETAGEETMRLVAHERELKDATKDNFADMTRVVESWGNRAADTFADFVVDGKASFSDLVNSMLKDIARLQAKKILDPITSGASGWLDKLFSGGSLFGGDAAPAASQGFGMAGDAGGLLGFAGGGFTGNGARTGGLDGQGGFLAMLHPQESVIDHAAGGSGGGITVVQHLNISVGVSQTVRAEIMNLMPTIQGAAKAAVMDARLRGGSARTAFAG
jgi:hypothetical protein